MSGDGVSYNLRPNKHVERHLFVDLLSILVADARKDNLVYVSLGGPQLEDHRLVHQRLGIENLISLEINETVYHRQKFNLRPSYIKCRNASITDFVNDFDNFQAEFPEQDKIIWLDYANANERREQLIEFETVLSELEEGDILKITMNAHPGTLGERRKDESTDEVQVVRRDELLRQLQGYVPDTLEPSDVTKNKLPSILGEAVKLASIRAVENYRKCTVVPLGIFTYQDGPHQMLTVTVRITKTSEIKSLQDRLMNRGWEYLPAGGDWQKYFKIEVPNLSAKERLHIEQVLGQKPVAEVHNELPFRFDSNDKVSLSMLEQYARHYRRYPSYFQVLL